MSRTVSTIDYKALAERLEMHAECHAHVEPYDDEQRQWAADLRTVVSLLDGMAEAQPIYAYEWDTYGGGVRRSFSPAPYNGREPKRTLILYTHPAPQPQPEPVDPHMIVAEDRFPDEPEPTEAQPMSEDYIRGYYAGSIVGAEKGRSEPTEAQIEWPARADEGMLRAMIGWRECDEREGLSGEASLFDRVYHALYSHMRDRAALAAKEN